MPTTEHFIPLLYLAGLCASAGRAPEVLVEGYAMGSLSMDAYTLDADCPKGAGDEPPAATVPDPSIVPPEETNL